MWAVRRFARHCLYWRKSRLHGVCVAAERILRSGNGSGNVRCGLRWWQRMRTSIFSLWLWRKSGGCFQTKDFFFRLPYPTMRSKRRGWSWRISSVRSRLTDWLQKRQRVESQTRIWSSIKSWNEWAFRFCLSIAFIRNWISLTLVWMTGKRGVWWRSIFWTVVIWISPGFLKVMTVRDTSVMRDMWTRWWRRISRWKENRWFGSIQMRLKRCGMIAAGSWNESRAAQPVSVTMTR